MTEKTDAGPSDWRTLFWTCPFSTLMERLADRFRAIIWGAIVVFYLLSFNGMWRIGKDSALYLSIARNIARGEGYTYLGESHRMAYPGLTYLLAGLMKIFGEHAIAVADGVMLISALLSIVLGYRLFRLLVRRGAAVIATMMVAVNLQIYELAFSILTDMPFMLATMMVLLGGAFCGVLPVPKLDDAARDASAKERTLGWFMLPAGLLLAAVMRPTFYVLGGCVLAGAFIAVAQRKQLKHAMRVFAVLLCAGAIFAMVCISDPRRSGQTQDIYEMAVSWQLGWALKNPAVLLAHAWQIVSPELPTAYFGFSLNVGNSAAVAVLLSAVVWVLWRWPVAMLWISATLLLQLVVEPVPRYMAPIIPILALGWWEAAARLNVRLYGKLTNTLAVAAFCLMVPNACRAVGKVWYDQYRRPFVVHYDRGQYEAITEVTDFIRLSLPKDAVLITPAKMDRVFSYLADRWAISADGQIPPQFAGRPLWVVLPQKDLDFRQLVKTKCTLGPKVMQTHATYRRSGNLVLRPAQWGASSASSRPDEE